MSDEIRRSTPVNQLGDTQTPELLEFMSFVNMITNASDAQHDLERPTAEERGDSLTNTFGINPETIADSILGSLFHIVPTNDGNGNDGDSDGSNGDGDDTLSDPRRSMRRHARRLRAEDQERLDMRSTVQFLMESYNNWQEQEWTNGYIYTTELFVSPEDRALQDAITRSMEEYENPLNPADPEIVSTLPKLKATVDMTENECPICKGAITTDEEVVSAATCKHYMHSDCADQWFLYGDFCAMCKLPVGGVKTEA